MLGCRCLLSVVVFVFHYFDGVLLQEHSRNAAKYSVNNDPTDEISLGGGGGGGWGLPDGIAVVGRIFRYQLLTHDASCGNLTNYQVAASDNGALPAWLLFNKTESALEGVPGSSDGGQVHGIQVTATCTGSTAPIEEHFTITVSDKEERLDGESPAALGSRSLKQNTVDDVTAMLVRCGADGAVTTATVTLDADDSRLTAVDRLHLLRRLASRLGLPETLLRLAADDHPHQRPVFFDDGPLVAGPGDAEHPANGPVLRVQWDVGCGNVFARHMPVLQLLEAASVNGSLSAAVGHGVVGWDVSSKRSVQSRSKRRVYFAYPTATPLPSAERPATRPVPTAIVPDKEGGPETRIVPTRTSVGVPGVTRTQSPPSRHKDASGIISPAVRLTKSPTPTTTYVTITATRVLSSVTGTGTALGGPGGSTTPPPPPPRNATSTPPSPGLIEPSIVSETPVRPGSTDALPTWTTSSSSLKLPTPPRATRRPPKTQKPSTPRFTTQQSDGTDVTLKPLDDIEVPVGRQVLVTLPDDLFTDYGTIEVLYIAVVNEDGSTSDIPPSWIRVNWTSRTLYGLPLDEEHIGTHRFKLVAINEEQRTIVTPLTVRIDPPPPAHEESNKFSVTFDLDYDKVANDLETRMNLINKIAAAFGDKDAGKMTILDISPGSVVITYTNNTLPSDPCPQKEIEALLRYLLRPDGQINETFAKALEPYRVIKAEGKATGSCASGTVSIASSPAAQSVTSQAKVTTSTPEDDVNVKPSIYKSDSNLLYILIPLLVFFVLLVLVIILCIVCCKRQRRRQKEEDKLTGLHKGIPIIFADELEDKPDTPASTLKSRSPDDEKRDQQHVPPPEYPTWKSSGSGSSTLRSDYKSPLLTDNEDDENKDDESTPPETLPRKRTLDENASTTEPLLHFKG